MKQPPLNKATGSALSTAIANRAAVVLLHGPTGAGKMAAARLLSGQLLGDDYEHARNLGVVQLYDGKDIGIEEVRQIIARVAIKHVESRVFIISRADSLGHEAQNALLKTLEQLPPNVHFVLTAGQTSRILPTIRSRAMSIAVKSLSLDEARRYYSDTSEHELTRAWQMSDGLAIILAKSLGRDDTLTNLISDAKDFLGMKTYDRLIFIDKYSKDREGLTAFIEGLVKILKALTTAAAAKDDKSLRRLISARKKLLNWQDALRANTNTRLIATALATDLGV